MWTIAVAGHVTDDQCIFWYSFSTACPNTGKACCDPAALEKLIEHVIKLPGLMEIIARGELPSTERKLLQAGAHRVVMPTHIGAERIAEMILFRETARFILDSERVQNFERVLRSLGLDLEVAIAAENSPIVGMTAAWVEDRAKGAFFIVQINRRDGDAIIQPPPGTVIGTGDGIVIVGRGARAHALGGLFAPKEDRRGGRQ